MKLSRRSFLKNSAAAAGAVALSSGVLKSVRAAVNPAISDSLVVTCLDSGMVTGAYSATTATQFSRLNNEKIKNNMDAMAKALAGKPTAAEAWAVIFTKPAAKNWSAVTVSIKVNCINASMYVKPAIIGKVCDALIALGVQPGNICLFDGGNATDQATSYNNYIGDGKPIPANVKTLAKTASQSVRNTRDIAVNCAINKGHSNSNSGQVTLCMKNLTGTYKFSCPSSINEIVGWSTDAITNGHQQLCIVDSLFGACDGPNAPADSQPNCISMSTHPAAIDALVTRKIRLDVMKCTEITATFDTFLARFGLNRANLQWVVVPPAGVVSIMKTRRTVSSGIFDVQTSGKNHILAVVKYRGKHTCTVRRLNGAVVASQNGSGPMTYYFTEHCAPGSYVVTFSGEDGHKEELTVNLFRR